MTQLISAINKYENIRFYNNFLTLRALLWGLYGGFMVGCVLSYYNKAVVGKLVRYLLKNKALSQDTAIKYSDLKIKGKWIFRIALKFDRALTRYVSITGDGAIDVKEPSSFMKKVRKFLNLDGKKKVYDFSKVEIYIPEEKRYAADANYEEKGSNPAGIIIAAVLMTAAVIALNIFIPELITMLDNFVGIISTAE